VRFRSYLYLTEEKNVKKIDRGLNSSIRIMMSYFDFRDFSQLVDRASIYEESLKENAAEYTDQKKRAQVTGTSIEEAELAKRMVVESFSPQRSQGRTSSNPTGWQPRLAISVDSLCEQRSCSETFGTSSGLHACSKRARRRIGSSDGCCPYTWI
jgi:hypothetical protein